MPTPRSYAVADPDRGTVLARVDLAVPPERVFRAVTGPEVVQWWGSPDRYRTTAFAMDVRVGGAWRSDGVMPDGSPFHVGGEITELDPPRLITFTWAPSWAPDERTVVTYRLEPTATGTRMTVRHTGFVSPATCADHANGWERVTGWLAAHLAAPDPLRHWFCRLVPPRATFPGDITEVERATMMQHAGYWAQRLAEGRAVIFGPVGSPQQAWGLGVLRAADQADVDALLAGDPIIAAGWGFRYETEPMLRAVY